MVLSPNLAVISGISFHVPVVAVDTDPACNTCKTRKAHRLDLTVVWRAKPYIELIGLGRSLWTILWKARDDFCSFLELGFAHGELRQNGSLQVGRGCVGQGIDCRYPR